MWIWMGNFISTASLCLSVCLSLSVYVCLYLPVGEVEPMTMDSEDEAASDAEMMTSLMMVHVGADCVPVPFSEVTPDMVATMTDAQKHEYIRIGQQLYDQFNH